MNKEYIYFSLRRPIGIGTVPKRLTPLYIKNYDRRQEAVHPYTSEKLGYEAWGYVVYQEELTEKEVSHYELMPANNRKWFGVIVRQDINTDDVMIRRYKTVTSAKQPECKETHGKNADVYLVWCGSEETAKRILLDTETAFDFVCKAFG